jgi:hypothetical protein
MGCSASVVRAELEGTIYSAGVRKASWGVQDDERENDRKKS